MISAWDILFAALVVMVLVWFVCVRRLSRQLRDRHAEKYEQMRMAELWPRNLSEWFSEHNNGRAVFAMMRFLYGREDRALRDPDISSLSAFMRWFSGVYMILLLLAMLTMGHPAWDRPVVGQQAAATASPADVRGARAYELHRAKKWDEALAAYDELLRDSGQDAKLTYWRGMAHWGAGNLALALQDFQRVIELEPANFDAYRSADRILSAQRRWEELLELWDRYLEKVPGDAEAYFERGGTNFHKGDLAAAHADAARACELGKTQACSLAERLKSER